MDILEVFEILLKHYELALLDKEKTNPIFRNGLCYAARHIINWDAYDLVYYYTENNRKINQIYIAKKGDVEFRVNYLKEQIKILKNGK